MIGFMESVKEATNGDTESIAQLFGGVESLLPVLQLTGTGAEAFTEILGDMETQAGETAEAVRKHGEEHYRAGTSSVCEYK